MPRRSQKLWLDLLMTSSSQRPTSFWLCLICPQSSRTAAAGLGSHLQSCPQTCDVLSTANRPPSWESLWLGHELTSQEREIGIPLLASGEASLGRGQGRKQVGPKAALRSQPSGKKLPRPPLHCRPPAHTWARVQLPERCSLVAPQFNA